MIKRPTAQAWQHNMSLDIPWAVAYEFVASVVKPALAEHNKPMTSAALVEMLFPAAWVADAQDDDALKRARARVFSALTALAKHSLKDWHTRMDPEMNNYGSPVRRYVWHTPGTKISTIVVAKPKPALDTGTEPAIAVVLPVRPAWKEPEPYDSAAFGVPAKSECDDF